MFGEGAVRAKVVLPFVLAPLVGVLAGIFLAGRNQDGAPTGAVELGTRQVPAGHRAAVEPAGSPDLESAFNVALQARPGDARTEALQRSFARWLLDAPDDALAHIASIPAQERHAVVTAAFAALALQRPSSFQQYATALAQYGTELAAVAAAIADSDPVQALKWARQYGRDDANAQLLGAVLPGLLRSDVTLAANTVAAMKEQAPLALVQQVAAAYARHDPAQAYAWTARLVESRTDVAPSRLLDEVSSSLAARDPQAATDFMNQSTEPAIRRSLMSELAIRKGQDDLGAAWTWLEQYGSDPAYADVAQSLLYRWSYTKPQEVAHILPKVGDVAVQANGAAYLTQFWQRSDRSAYQNWIASLPPGQLRSAALAAK